MTSIAATAMSESNSSIIQENDTSSSNDSMVRSVPPSHILHDGRFIHLPPLSDVEHARFLERSIARHGLLDQDLGQQQKEQEKETRESENEESEEKQNDDDTVSQRVHPLAVASARLHANGISELSKAINLAGLVSSGDYFGLSNIIDPKAEEQGDSNKTSSKETTDSKLRSTFLCKRKRAQFQDATELLQQQSRRLANAVVAQNVVDDRLCQVRKRWRLVAPEHGTRAQAHAVRPTEVVAVDVHVYDRDRTGGGNQALLQKDDLQGQIARRVPRYATVELHDSYNVSKHVEEWKQQQQQDGGGPQQEDSSSNDDNTEKQETCETCCEPFAVADPTLGKIDVDFDPDKVPMLTLELTIEKPWTVYKESACLPPISFENKAALSPDEEVVVTLQHSLFCASLFESIRKELSFDEQQQQQQEQCWLSGEAEETFLPPPSKMAGSIYNGDVATLCVVHCHEGEVKVQLDSEYVLTVKLLEATKKDEDSMDVDEKQKSSNGSSGSQSPAQLQVLCRALLLHIQSVYHKHCIGIRSKMLQEEKEEAAPGLARIKKKSVVPSPFILQNCVSLGAKIMFEGKIRRALKRVSKWLKSDIHTDEPFVVEWLPQSMFDLGSQFTLSFRDVLVDVIIDRDGMTVTSCGQDSGYKSVTFNSDIEFEIFLKFEIRNQLKKT